MIANNTNESLDSIMWNMSALQAFSMVKMVYTANTGKDVKTHEEKQVIRQQQETFKGLKDG